MRHRAEREGDRFCEKFTCSGGLATREEGEGYAVFLPFQYFTFNGAFSWEIQKYCMVFLGTANYGLSIEIG